MSLSQNWDWKVQNFIDRWRALNRRRAPNQWRAPNRWQSPKRWQSPNSEFGARLDCNVQLPTSLVAIGDGHLRSRKLEVGSWKLEVGSRKLEVGSRKSEASSLNVTVTIQFIYLDFDFLLVTLSILASQVNRSL